MQTQYNILRIDLYFHDYKLAIETDENSHSDRNINYKIKSQKAIEQEPACRIFRIDPNKEGFGIFRAFNKIFRHIKRSIEKNSNKWNLNQIIRIRV